MSQATAPAADITVPDGELGHRFEAIRANIEARQDGDVSDADVLAALYDAYWQSVEPLDPEDDPNQTALTDVATEPAESAENDATVRDDRVVSVGSACGEDGCERPAGAHGLCTAHWREYNGHAIGNHGGRL